MGWPPPNFTSKYSLYSLKLIKKIIKLLGVRRVDFEVLLDLVDLEMVHGHSFGLGKRLLHIDIELTGEIIGVGDTENSLIEVDILCDVEVFPGVELLDSEFLGDLLTVHKNALGDSRVLHSRFSHVDGLVVEIVVQNAGTHSVVLQLTLNHSFLEVTEETQHLTVVLQPRGLNTGDVVVLGGFSGAAEVGRGLCAERFEQHRVQVFTNIISFLTH